MSFLIGSRLIRVLRCRQSRHALAAGNEVDQYQDNGNHEEDVNKRTDRMTGDQAQRPQNQQYYRNSPQHMIFLFLLVMQPGNDLVSCLTLPRSVGGPAPEFFTRRRL